MNSTQHEGVVSKFLVWNLYIVQVCKALPSSQSLHCGVLHTIWNYILSMDQTPRLPPAGLSSLWPPNHVGSHNCRCMLEAALHNLFGPFLKLILNPSLRPFTGKLGRLHLGRGITAHPTHQLISECLCESTLLHLVMPQPDYPVTGHPRAANGLYNFMYHQKPLKAEQKGRQLEYIPLPFLFLNILWPRYMASLTGLFRGSHPFLS